MENTRKMKNASAEKKNANVSKRNERNEKKTAKSGAEKQAAREAREAKRVERICAAADKASAWEHARGLVNMAGAHEREALLNATSFIYFFAELDEAGKAKHTQTHDAAVAYIREAVRTLATPDLCAVLAAVPAHVLAKAVRADGSLKVSTIAREMAHEIAKNPQTALAVAHAAADAQRKAARKARKAAKKAEKAAQGKAGAK